MESIVKSEPGEGQEETLNSNDDDSSEDKAEPVTSNIIITQYEKILRTKNKYTVTLRAGIMHLNGFDYPFNNATGKFDW